MDLSTQSKLLPFPISTLLLCTLTGLRGKEQKAREGSGLSSKAQASQQGHARGKGSAALPDRGWNKKEEMSWRQEEASHAQVTQ